MVTFNDYITALSSNTREPIIEIEFLRQDETPKDKVVLDLRLEGSLNINNKNGVRRSMNLVLDNVLESYFPDIDTNVWIGKKVKLKLGLRINSEDYTFPSGVFVIDDPVVSSDGAVSLNCVDKYSLLDGSLGGVIDSIIIINAGTTLVNAVKSIMTLSQDSKTPIIDTTVSALTLPYQIIHEEGSTLGAILEEIAFAFSCNVYYNEEGVLVFEKDIQDNTKGAIWEFKSDQYEVNYISGSSTYKFSDVYNDVIIIGDNINGAIARGRVTNNDLLSPTSVPNIGFKKTMVITDNIINTNGLAVERGKYELKRATQLLTETSIMSIPLYHLDVDNVVKLNDNRLNFNGKRSVINSLSIPFNNSTMSINLVDSFEVTL